MERALVVQKAANKLFATEASIDKAMADAAMLLIELQTVRAELNTSAIFADEATAKATASLAALAQARSAIVACHAEMAEAKLRLGIRTKLTGTGDKPPPGQQDIAPGHLRQVG
jgi:hypothetical protein